MGSTYPSAHQQAPSTMACLYGQGAQCCWGKVTNTCVPEILISASRTHPPSGTGCLFIPFRDQRVPLRSMARLAGRVRSSRSSRLPTPVRTMTSVRLNAFDSVRSCVPSRCRSESRYGVRGLRKSVQTGAETASQCRSARRTLHTTGGCSFRSTTGSRPARPVGAGAR